MLVSFLVNFFSCFLYFNIVHFLTLLVSLYDFPHLYFSPYCCLAKVSVRVFLIQTYVFRVIFSGASESGGCGDLLFSGHGTVVTAVTCLVWVQVCTLIYVFFYVFIHLSMSLYYNMPAFSVP